MPNLAALMKLEIRRQARREIKAEVSAAKKSIAKFRREIAALKRQVADLARKLAKAGTRERGASAAAIDSESDGSRFSTRSVKAQRRRLGLSAKDYGRLIGVSQLTVYHWEQGKSRPRQKQMAALVAVRGIGKREALRRLAESNGQH